MQKRSQFISVKHVKCNLAFCFERWCHSHLGGPAKLVPDHVRQREDLHREEDLNLARTSPFLLFFSDEHVFLPFLFSHPNILSLGAFDIHSKHFQRSRQKAAVTSLAPMLMTEEAGSHVFALFLHQLRIEWNIHNGGGHLALSFSMHFRGQERVNFEEFAIKIRYRPRHLLCMKITYPSRGEPRESPNISHFFHLQKRFAVLEFQNFAMRFSSFFLWCHFQETSGMSNLTSWSSALAQATMYQALKGSRVGKGERKCGVFYDTFYFTAGQRSSRQNAMKTSKQRYRVSHSVTKKSS